MTTSSVPPTAGPFPTDPAGLPECARPEVVELSDGDEFDLRIAPVAKRARRRDRADAGLQRVDPRPDPEGAGGIGGGRQRHQRR